MHIAIIGRQDLPKGVLETFVNRTGAIACVLWVPRKPGVEHIPLCIAAQNRRAFPCVNCPAARHKKHPRRCVCSTSTLGPWPTSCSSYLNYSQTFGVQDAP